MIDKNKTHDEHYVPRMYLKNFTNEDGKFWILNKEAIKYHPNIDTLVREATPKSVCFEKDMYEFKIGDNFLYQNVIENIFCKYECDAEPELTKIIAKIDNVRYLHLNKKEKSFIIEFALFIYYRNLIVQNVIDEIGVPNELKKYFDKNTIIKNNMPLIVQNLMFSVIPKQAKIILKEGKFKVYKYKKTNPQVITDIPIAYIYENKYKCPHMFIPLSSYISIEIADKRKHRKDRDCSIVCIPNGAITFMEWNDFNNYTKYLICESKNKLLAEYKWWTKGDQK